MRNTQKGFIVPLLIAIIAVLAIGGGIYVFEQSKPQQTEQQPTTYNQAVSTTNQTTNSKTYTNSQYGFQINYPVGWDVMPNPNNGTAINAAFYFSPVGKYYQNNGQISDAKWVVDVLPKDQVSNINNVVQLYKGTKFTSGNDTYVVYNEGLQPELFGVFVASFKFTASNQAVTTPNSNVSQTDPLADIQVLSNVVPAGSFNFVKGGLSACQPEFFDPKVTKFQKSPTGGSPAELYKIAGSDESVGMMINGWSNEGENKISLASPFDLTTYQFGCASSFSFVADITKNAVRQSLFTNVDNFLTQKSVSEDKTHIFLVNNIKDTNGDWQLKKRIVNVENDTKTDLPNMSCVSDLGFWNGNKLLTYSDYNLPSNSNSDKTKVCVWNTDGKLLNQVASKLYWPAASAYYLGAQIGLLPKDSNIFYTYNSVASSQNACYVNLQDLTNQSKNKKIKITDADSNGVCPSVKLDLSNVTFGSNTIPYQIVTQ